ncbi:hypothetical protein Tco_0382895 [Tanacetum coccineum]
MLQLKEAIRLLDSLSTALLIHMDKIGNSSTRQLMQQGQCRDGGVGRLSPRKARSPPHSFEVGLARIGSDWCGGGIELGAPPPSLGVHLHYDLLRPGCEVCGGSILRRNVLLASDA